MKKEKVLIIGAGPAGLTAAYELLDSNRYEIVIVEATGDIGGISKTVNYKNNRIDIGGHRFFSKNQKVMNWWENILPIQGKQCFDYEQTNITLDLSTKTDAPDPNLVDKVMLIRNRLSRIYFLRKFFDYPISLSIQTLKNLGLIRVMKIGFSYVKSVIFPIKDEKNLEDFFINRFGKELYKTFFKDYTHKVWGVTCEKISPNWGAQRIKGLSIIKTIQHALKKIFIRKNTIEQKNVETSLIERFWYPKLGPGQLWESVLELCIKEGTQLIKDSEIDRLIIEDNKVKALYANNEEFKADHVISTMPIKDLVESIEDVRLDSKVKKIASNLQYRDFLTVGVLLDDLKIKNSTNRETLNNIVPDNWIYIQESDVKVGRLQIFNNWSPYLVEDINNTWLGMEYFCNEGDELWSLSEEQMKEFAINELEKMDMIDKNTKILDMVVIKVKKAYPAYFGSYEQFDQVKEYLNTIDNLYCIGRNGMHRYNNMDHSMLSAMEAVENIKNNINSKNNIWKVNAEEEYHETKS